MTTEDGRPVAILRSPGRINLMGRHVDHQGGSVNVMAINRELLVVASPRQDDLVQVRNADPARFPPNSFRITQLISELDWNDWLSAVEGPRTRRLLDLARGDWSTYVKAAVLRLQEHFRDRLLHGMDLFVAGDIPMGAGLSSSSALVVAAAEACARFNDLPLTPRDLVGLCGEGEWFVGTRGGTADHAAIRLSERGTLQRIGFFPFRIEGTAPFPEGHDLVVCNSGIYAGKSADARHRYNQKVTSYHIARTLFRHLRPGLADRIEHLRDITPQRLGVPFPDFCSLLGELPESVSREEVRQFLRHVSESEVERLERLFESHEEPAGGYRVRDVAVFGLTEIERAQRCLGCLETGAVDELGRLMTASHDGDRISVRGPDGVRVPATARVTLRDLQEIGQSPAPAERFSLYPGSYACSLPEIDEIVDTLLDMPGVRGAQMAGAGLGGCVMALVSTDTSTAAVEALRRRGLEADVLHPIAGAAVLPAPH
jgi:N-acetylgalactosamine kinase